MAFSNFISWKPGRDLPGFFYPTPSRSEPKTLGDLPVGTRLLYRSRTDWRDAVVSRKTEERVVLSIGTASGRNYRLRKLYDSEIYLDGSFIVFRSDEDDTWRENLAPYDLRW